MNSERFLMLALSLLMINLIIFEKCTVYAQINPEDTSKRLEELKARVRSMQEDGRRGENSRASEGTKMSSPRGGPSAEEIKALQEQRLKQYEDQKRQRMDSFKANQIPSNVGGNAHAEPAIQNPPENSVGNSAAGGNHEPDLEKLKKEKMDLQKARAQEAHELLKSRGVDPDTMKHQSIQADKLAKASLDVHSDGLTSTDKSSTSISREKEHDHHAEVQRQLFESQIQREERTHERVIEKARRAGFQGAELEKIIEELSQVKEKHIEMHKTRMNRMARKPGEDGEHMTPEKLSAMLEELHAKNRELFDERQRIEQVIIAKEKEQLSKFRSRHEEI